MPRSEMSPNDPPAWQKQLMAAPLKVIFGLPRPLLRAIAGAPLHLDGQRLALEVQVLLRLMRLTKRDKLSHPSVSAARAGMRAGRHLTGARPLPGVHVKSLSVPSDSGSIPARLYRPQQLSDTSELLVYYHGGGWVIGDLDSHDDLCRFLALQAGLRVLSVDYRLAPEHRFPAAVDDALAAYQYAVNNAAELGTAPGKIAVGGDSAGGNLAAVVAHHATRAGWTPPIHQLLLYPAVDASQRRRSRELFGNGFLLTDGDMDWFLDHYAPNGESRSDPRLSVLLSDDFKGLPPAQIVTAGFDPLRDEGEAYAQRLSEAGVPVHLRRFENLIHGFVSMRQVGGVFHDSLLEIAGSLRAALALRDSLARGSSSRARKSTGNSKASGNSKSSSGSAKSNTSGNKSTTSRSRKTTPKTNN